MRRPTPEIFDSWDSMEGVAPATPSRQGPPLTPRLRAQNALAWVGDRVPGVFLAAALAFLADAAAGAIGSALFGGGVNPISGIPVAIAMGIALCNGIGIPEVFHAGLLACMRPLQRLAIMLLGWRLSIAAIGGIGLQSLPVIVVTITAALVLVPWIGSRVGLSRRLATLIAVGTSICGVSAIMATAPAIEAEEGEVSYAVACVAIFGMLAMLTYPFFAAALVGTGPLSIGIFFGSAIHDTAQVTGAALAYQQGHNAPDVLNIATVVKIMRNLSMAAVIPLMAGLFHRGRTDGARIGQRIQVFPPFVLGFLGFTVLRTLGDATPRAFGFLAPSQWKGFLGVMDRASTGLLTVVMAAVGLSTGFAALQRLGWRPFFVGLFAAFTVGGVGVGVIRLVALLR
jgi:uncharacterized integral membrane protein (TIGR00698 family)